MAKNAGSKQKRSARAAVAAPGRPARLQVGALCWRRTGAGVVKILLITSRDTGRWVIPKGWPMRKRTEAGAAEREAWEEAGVRGETGPSFGFFSYAKNLGRGVSLDCLVHVFLLEVREMRRKYPEIGQRRVKWFPVGKAAEKVAEAELAAMIRLFGEEMAAESREAAAAEAAGEQPTETAEGPAAG